VNFWPIPGTDKNGYGFVFPLRPGEISTSGRFSHSSRLRTCFPGILGEFRPLRGSSRLLGSRTRSAPRSRHLPDSRISREDKLLRAQRGLFEILRVGREDLPAGHLLPEHLNRAHVRKLPPQTLMVLFGRGQPHSVVRRPIALVAEDEDYLVLNLDREAAKHGASLGRQRSHRVEHELMRTGYRGLMARGSKLKWLFARELSCPGSRPSIA
jgi:hypothetical protein